MGVTRPTFHESWHRVAPLRPRLRTGVPVYRRRFRGRSWHIIEDPTAGRYFRVSAGGYRFLALLDGRTTADEAWRACAEELADEAPTQGEAIRLLAQLHASNLIAADIPSDAEAVLRRERRQALRRAAARFVNLLCVRIPLFDPDRFLDRWLPLVAWLFTRTGMIIWMLIVAVGGLHLLGRGRDLLAGASSVLDTGNLPLLYGCIVFAKLLHELGHAFAAKALGRLHGDDGPGRGHVRAIGVMFLVLLPLPYVDASSAWTFKRKAHRVIVGAAGMMAELAVAAVAAVVWARAAQDSTASAVAYNLIFTAGVSTLLFNLNPLLKYDGYFILCDLLETPNLAQRSRDLVLGRFKRAVWGVRNAAMPRVAPGEAAWMSLYAVLAFVYRIFVCVAILLFIADQQLLLGGVLIVAAAAAWILFPAATIVRYLAASPELDRRRRRAALTTLAPLAFLIAAGLVVPAPHYAVLGGVVRPAQQAEVYASTPGFVAEALATGAEVTAGQTVILRAVSPEAAVRLASLDADLRRLRTAHRLSLAEDPAAGQALAARLAAAGEQRDHADRDLRALTVLPAVSGVWISDAEHDPTGSYIDRGGRIGVVADLSRLEIVVTAGQHDAALLISEARAEAAARTPAEPARSLPCRVVSVAPAASASPTGRSDEEATGDAPARMGFEARFALDDPGGLRPGQTAFVRVRLADRPPLVRAWLSIRQVMQERFRI